MATEEELRKAGEERGKNWEDISDLEKQADTKEKQSALVQGIVKGLGGDDD